MNITSGDAKFIRDTLLPWSGFRAVYIASSNSPRKWPDIWVSRGKIPVLTVTEEWRSHNTQLRRSQLVHEFLHIRGLEHGRIGQYDYNTKPDLDTYSKKVYRELVKNPILPEIGSGIVAGIGIGTGWSLVEYAKDKLKKSRKKK